MKGKTIGIIFIAAACAFFLSLQSACCQVQGTIKDCGANRRGIDNALVSTDDGAHVCSAATGLYSFDPAPGPRKITFRKKGYKPHTETITVKESGTDRVDVCLSAGNPAAEISGDTGIRGKGITVNLYKLEGASYSAKPVETFITCADGTYSFSELADGTYKIEPACSVCTFSPNENAGIQISTGNEAARSINTVNFKAACDPGACQ